MKGVMGVKGRKAVFFFVAGVDRWAAGKRHMKRLPK